MGGEPVLELEDEWRVRNISSKAERNCPRVAYLVKNPAQYGLRYSITTMLRIGYIT